MDDNCNEPEHDLFRIVYVHKGDEIQARVHPGVAEMNGTMQARIVQFAYRAIDKLAKEYGVSFVQPPKN